MQSESVPLVSTAKHVYKTRSLRINDPFEADNEEDAADLIALGFAVRAPAAAKVKRTYQRRDMEAE